MAPGGAAADERLGEAIAGKRPALLEIVEDGRDRVGGEAARAELALELETAVLAACEQVERATLAVCGVEARGSRALRVVG